MNDKFLTYMYRHRYSIPFHVGKVLYAKYTGYKSKHDNKCAYTRPEHFEYFCKTKEILQATFYIIHAKYP